MDKDRVAGSADQAKGTVKETVGRLTGDAKLEAEGRGDRAGGKLQNMIGGVKDAIRNALGGKLFAIGSLEVTVPTFLPENFPIKASLFTDFGTLGGLDRSDKITCTNASPPVCGPNPAVKDSFALRAAAGISIGWRSPLGPIQFDISKVLAKEAYDETESFRFSTSTRF